MFRLIRALIALILLGALAYLAVSVPLGDKTLWEHIQAIAGTDESKQLVKGVKQKAQEVLDEQIRADGSTPQSDKPQEDTTEADKEQLRRILRERLKASPGSGT
jgi:hypothetical protein